MQIKKNKAKSYSDFEYIFDTIKKEIISIVIITLTIAVLITLITFKINSNSSFKSETTLDGSRNLNLDSVTSLVNVLNSFLTENENSQAPELKINFFDLYLTTMDQKFFYEILDENKFYNRENFNSEQDYKKEIYDLYKNNLQLVVEKKIIYENQITNSQWSLKFTAHHDKKDKWSEILKLINKKSLADFKKKVIKHLDSKLLIINILIDNDIKKIDNEIDFTLRNHFNYKQNELLKYLTEQAAIARELGIDNGLEYITNIVEASEVFNLNDKRGDEFLNFQWGYIAIEKKIVDILSREKKDAKYFVGEYQNLNKKRAELEREKSYYNELYKESINNIPFFLEEDSSLGYLDIYSTKFSSNKINAVVIMLMIIVASFIFNSIFIALKLFNNKNINRS